MAKKRWIAGYQCGCNKGKSSLRSGIGDDCTCLPLRPNGSVDLEAKPVSMKKLVVMW